MANRGLLGSGLVLGTDMLTKRLESVADRLRARGEHELAEELRALAGALQEDQGAEADLLTSDEAAAVLGIRSGYALRRLAREGLLHAFHYRGTMLFERESVERLADRSELAHQRAYERELDEALAPFDTDAAAAEGWTGAAHRGRKPWDASSAPSV